MARVLIVEPEHDLRLLATEAVAELGHEPVVSGDEGSDADLDVLLLAPCTGMLALVAGLRRNNPALSVVCVGDGPPIAEARAVRPAAYLMKPYSLAALDAALALALAREGGPMGHGDPTPTRIRTR